jgi:hypothetical protein
MQANGTNQRIPLNWTQLTKKKRPASAGRPPEGGRYLGKSANALRTTLSRPAPASSFTIRNRWPSRDTS